MSFKRFREGIRTLQKKKKKNSQSNGRKAQKRTVCQWHREELSIALASTARQVMLEW